MHLNHSFCCVPFYGIQTRLFRDLIIHSIQFERIELALCNTYAASDAAVLEDKHRIFFLRFTPWGRLSADHLHRADDRRLLSEPVEALTQKSGKFQPFFYFRSEIDLYLPSNPYSNKLKSAQCFDKLSTSLT